VTDGCLADSKRDPGVRQGIAGFPVAISVRFLAIRRWQRLLPMLELAGPACFPVVAVLARLIHMGGFDQPKRYVVLGAPSRFPRPQL